MKAGYLAAALRPLALVALLASFPAAAEVVQPLPPVGSHAVGCTNVEQDFARVPPGESAEDYWEGLPRNGTPRFVTDLLVDPVHALVYQQKIPDDSGVFGSFAGRTMPYVLVICYPTDPANPRPITCCRRAT
jgi:hypothetical protein